SVRDEWAAGIAVALPDFGAPNILAVPRVERDDAVAARQVELVLINGDAAHGDVRTEVIFPNHFAAQAIDRLDDAAGVREKDDPVMHDRSGLIGSALIHGMFPDELQVPDIIFRDLIERAVV